MALCEHLEYHVARTFVGSIFATWKNRLNISNIVLLLHTFGLFAFYYLASASYDRFLIPIIPYWAIIFGIGLDNLQQKTNIFKEIKKELKNYKIVCLPN